MKTQENIARRIMKFRMQPELDVLSIKRELLLRFVSYETLLTLGPITISKSEWEEISLERVSVVHHFLVLLYRMYRESVSRRSHSMLSRMFQEVQEYLWILDDEGELDDLYFGPSACIVLSQRLIKRYEEKS